MSKRERKAAKARISERARLDRECPNCAGKELLYVSTINTGASNEEGAYLQSLYQCPCCKMVLVK